MYPEALEPAYNRKGASSMGDENREGVIRHNWAPEKFAQVPNFILYDERANTISLKSKGLYALLAGFQPGRRISIRYLACFTSDGRDAILAAVAQLKDLGVLRIEQIRDAEGRVVGSRWILYEDPESAPPESDNPTLGPTDWRGVRPGSDYPDTGKPQQLRLRDQSRREDKGRQYCDPLELEFVTNWNLLAVPYLPGVDACHQLTPAQRKSLGKLAGDRYWVDHWLDALNRIRSSAFLCGAVPTQQCPEGFVATLGLVLSEKFVPNMLQGVYHRDGHLEPGQNAQGDPVL